MKAGLARLVVIVGLYGGAGVAHAQDPQPVPLSVHERPVDILLATLPSTSLDVNWRSSAPPPGTVAIDKKFKALAAALYTSMIADTKSTFDSRAWCPRCAETNPYAAPFVNAGPDTAYAAGVAFDTSIMYLSARMRTAANPVLRKIWFALPVSLIAGHAWAMRHNYGLRRFCAASPTCGRPGGQ